MSQSARQFVTVERIDAAIAALHARIDALRTELSTRIDAVEARLSARIDAVETGLIARIDTIRAELRAEIWRAILVAVGVLIASNALMVAVLGIILSRGMGPGISP